MNMPVIDTPRPTANATVVVTVMGGHTHQIDYMGGDVPVEDYLRANDDTLNIDNTAVVTVDGKTVTLNFVPQPGSTVVVTSRITNG